MSTTRRNQVKLPWEAAGKTDTRPSPLAVEVTKGCPLTVTFQVKEM